MDEESMGNINQKSLFVQQVESCFEGNPVNEHSNTHTHTHLQVGRML